MPAARRGSLESGAPGPEPGRSLLAEGMSGDSRPMRASRRRPQSDAVAELARMPSTLMAIAFSASDMSSA